MNTTYHAGFLGFKLSEINDGTSVLVKEINSTQLKDRMDQIHMLAEEDIMGSLSLIFKRNVNQDFSFQVNEVIENAVRHSVRDTPIRIEIKRHNDTASLLVENIADIPHAGRLRSTLEHISASFTMGLSTTDIVNKKYSEVAAIDGNSDHISLYMMLINSSNPFGFDIEAMEHKQFKIRSYQHFSIQSVNTLYSSDRLSIDFDKSQSTFVLSGKFTEDKPAYKDIFQGISDAIPDVEEIATFDLTSVSRMNSGGILKLSRVCNSLLNCNKRIVIKVSKINPWQETSFSVITNAHSDIGLVVV